MPVVYTLCCHDVMNINRTCPLLAAQGLNAPTYEVLPIYMYLGTP